MNTIYLFPGIGCTAAVFEKMRFPSSYAVRVVEWIEPRCDEGMARYCRRLTEGIDFRAGDILAGVSLGGIVAQQIARENPQIERVFVLSSAIHPREYALPIRLFRALRLYRLTPGWIFRLARLRTYLMTGHTDAKRVRAVERFFAPLSGRYFRFALRVCMDFPPADKELIRRVRRIHGHRDALFPVRRLISPLEDIESATHLMVYSHARAVSEAFARLIRAPWYR